MNGFFAVDRNAFVQACEISLNSGIAYLVLARGSGGDNSTTSWSANAIEKYTSISRSRSKNAIKDLLSSKLITRTLKGLRPQYKIQATKKKGRLDSNAIIWLPNTIVTSASNETPPIERIRQSQDVKCLELFIDLYGAQNLREDGGLRRSIIKIDHDRELLSENGPCNVWGFTASDSMTTMMEDEIVALHLEVDEDNKTVFWRRIQRLLSLGLVYWVPHLYESDNEDAEIIHPLGDEDDIEAKLHELAHDAAMALLPEQYEYRAVDQFNFLAPVPKHIPDVTVISIARLRHRPHTQLTAAWWAELQNNGALHLEEYRNIIAGNNNLQYQGKIKVNSR